MRSLLVVKSCYLLVEFSLFARVVGLATRALTAVGSSVRVLIASRLSTGGEAGVVAALGLSCDGQQRWVMIMERSVT